MMLSLPSKHPENAFQGKQCPPPQRREHRADVDEPQQGRPERSRSRTPAGWVLPVTLYKEQGAKLLAMTDEINA
jgi:hypothetical protein